LDKQQYYKLLGFQGTPPDYLTTEIAEAIINRNLTSNSLLSILALQDIFSLSYDVRTYHPKDERVNVPGTITVDNWSWRMGITLEDLLNNQKLNDRVRLLVSRSGRQPKK